MDKQYILDYCRKTPENLNVNVLSTLIDAYLYDNTGSYEEESVEVVYGNITTTKKTGTFAIDSGSEYDIADLVDLMKAGKTIDFVDASGSKPDLYSVTFVDGENPTIYAASKFDNTGYYAVLTNSASTSYYSKMND